LFLGQFQELVLKPGGKSALAAWLIGVAVSLLGIVITGAAGMSKEREMSDAAKKAAVAEFNFSKGIAVAIFSGVMSAGMNFGIQAAENSIVPLTREIAPVTSKTWQGLPGLIVILLGGFTVNAVWCVLLNRKNRTAGDYAKARAPLAGNYLFSALAGILWYSQMVFLTMGNAKIGKYSFSGWSVFMSSQIIFSTFWGMALLEWKGTSPRTRKLLAAGLAVLVISLVIIGYGNRLSAGTS
jgi:L-rhamnose-H+ transport protein